MARLLVHIATGPSDGTRAALGFLVARTALDQGHTVDLFLAGEAVNLLRPETMDLVQGIGTGNLREHHAALVAGGARFFLSGMSSKARGVTAETLGVPAELVPPSRLVELIFEADRVVSY